MANHSLWCGKSGERIAWHSAQCGELHSTAAAASLGPSKEIRFLLLGTDRRPADVYLPYWSGGRDTAWDVTVTRAAITPHPGLHLASSRFAAKN